MPTAILHRMTFADSEKSKYGSALSDFKISLFDRVAFLLYLPYLLKLLVLNAKLKEPLENPVAASVLPTFTMATLLLK